jgi:hypothetical protein
MDNTLIDWLGWLGSGAGVIAVSALASRLMERFAWFQNIDAGAKKAVVVSVAALVALAGYALGQWLTANPNINAAIAPYAALLFTVLGGVTTQIAHGMAKEAAERKASERKAYVRMVRAAVDDGAAG